VSGSSLLRSPDNSTLHIHHIHVFASHSLPLTLVLSALSFCLALSASFLLCHRRVKESKHQVRLQLCVVSSEGDIHPLAQHVQLILRSAKFEGTEGKHSTKFEGTEGKCITRNGLDASVIHDFMSD